MTTPAVLGGPPAFADGLRFARPATPPLEAVVARLTPSYDDGQITNGRLVRELEAAMAQRLGVRHAVAVSSCTSGLILALQSAAGPGPVVVPGFTFSASAHAAVWAGRAVRFVECHPASFQVEPGAVAEALAGAGAVLATHVFGAPCEIEALWSATSRAGVPLLFDAAHAMGALADGVPVGGQGAAHVFSLSPTKLVAAGEGGIVATDDDGLADHVRVGRDYGNPGDYDTRFVGLNARLSELHAALALESLAELDDHLARRRQLASRYAAGLAPVVGVEVQHVSETDVSTYKDFTIRVDADTFGLGRDGLRDALAADGIDTRTYFDPPVHRQQAYAAAAPPALPVTEATAVSVLSLPMFRDLADDAVDRVVEVLAAVGARGPEVARALEG